MATPIDRVARDEIAVTIMEGCHDFIQAWADGMKMDQPSMEKAMTLRMQIDMYLGYCPWGEPEKRSDAPASTVNSTHAVHFSP